MLIPLALIWCSSITYPPPSNLLDPQPLEGLRCRSAGVGESFPAPEGDSKASRYRAVGEPGRYKAILAARKAPAERQRATLQGVKGELGKIVA